MADVLIRATLILAGCCTDEAEDVEGNVPCLDKAPVGIGSVRMTSIHQKTHVSGKLNEGKKEGKKHAGQERAQRSREKRQKT